MPTTIKKIGVKTSTGIDDGPKEVIIKLRESISIITDPIELIIELN